MRAAENVLVQLERKIARAQKAISEAMEERQRLSAEREAMRAGLEAAARANPQPGDRYTEMYSFWLYVVGRDGDMVTIMHASPPCVFPDDATQETISVAEFGGRFRGWTRLISRGENVVGWMRGDG